MTQTSKRFKCVVQSIDGDVVTLLFDGHQTLELSRKDLRGDLALGDVVYAVFTEEEEEKTVRDMAKEALNEILDADISVEN
jgi:hypothetical protein